MLTICDQYASRHHLIFNPTKTKCMFFPTNKNMKQFPVIFKSESILCRDDNSTFLLTSVEMSQIIEYLCTI